MVRSFLAVLLLTAVAHAGQQKFEAVPGEYVVKFKSGSNISSVSVKSLSARLGVPVKEVISTNLRLALVTSGDAGIRSLNKNSEIEYIEPNYIYRISEVPNDPSFEQLWGLKNTGQEIKSTDSQEIIVGTPGIDIGAEKAWEITKGSKDVVIAVIDTGVQYTNPDLAENMWINEKEKTGTTGKDDDGNGYVDDIYGYNFIAGSKGDPMDDHGHGTHCSGTIGARGNNSLDVAGVNWTVRIMALKFLTAQGSGSLADAVKAIDYATKNGAQIMSNSWGGGPYTKTMEDAIKAAAAKNVLFVAAAGNNGTNNDTTPVYPAGYKVENVLAVAAINNLGNRADFSCYGAKSVHVAAPGVKILSHTLTGLQAWNGTSMATPHVAGIAGLLKSVAPTMKATEIKERIVNTVQKLPSLKGMVASGGLVNAYNALTNTVPEPDKNDPANWKDVVEYKLSTDHPYQNKYTQSFEVKVAGAVKLAVHFAKFDFEAGYDFVQFFDKSGKEVGKYTGVHDDDFAPVVDGDTLVVVVKSDDSVNKYGFDIDKIAYKKE